MVNVSWIEWTLAGANLLAFGGTAWCAWQNRALRKRLESITIEADDLASQEPALPNETLVRRLAAMQNSVELLQSGLAEVQSRVETRPAFPTILPINLNRRGQMLQMHRSGESPSAIASTLGISQGEVKLTIRMQELHSETTEKENSRKAL